jgi:uncharacterized surface protein with fasciclin (FAS1) repeats
MWKVFIPFLKGLLQLQEFFFSFCGKSSQIYSCYYFERIDSIRQLYSILPGKFVLMKLARFLMSITWSAANGKAFLFSVFLFFSPSVHQKVKHVFIVNLSHSRLVIYLFVCYSCITLETKFFNHLKQMPMRKFLMAAILLPSLLFVSCQKNNSDVLDENATQQGIVALLQSLSVDIKKTEDAQSRSSTPRQASFKLLSFAIARAGLANELNDPNFAYTLFAPTDEAFAALGLGTRQAINGVPVERLKAILLYHVLSSRVLAAQVPSTYTELTMLSNQKAYIIRLGGNVYINGASVVSADIAAKTGVIHAIDRVLLPPAGNIVEVAAANPNFTYLVAAVQRAGLVNALTGAGPLTVFAPTNQAFIDAGFPTIASIEAAPASALIPILTYHVFGGRAFSSDLTNGQVLTMLSGGTTSISLTGGAKIDGASSALSNIIQTDIMATNGVIHAIDRVLLP